MSDSPDEDGSMGLGDLLSSGWDLAFGGWVGTDDTQMERGCGGQSMEFGRYSFTDVEISTALHIGVLG